MDLPKRSLSQGSPRVSPKATRRRDMESDENVRAWSQSPRRVVVERAASPQMKKVLGERNGGGGGRGTATPPPSQAKPAASPPSLSGRGAGMYDPKTNYTTPRPDFLRYNPEKRREILLRLEREAEDESSSSTSGTAVSKLASSGSSAQFNDTESDDDVDEDEEVPAPRLGWARRLFLMLVPVACSCCYICCTNPRPFPAPEMGLNFVGPIGSSINQVESGSGTPTEMIDSGHVFEEATVLQSAHRKSENAVQLCGHSGFPKNFMTTATMGLADVCPNVPSGDLTCQIGDRSIENVQKSKEDCQLSEQELETTFEYAEQSREVASLVGNVVSDSIGSTHTADMEEGKSRLAHQEEREDHSNHSPQLAFKEKALELEKVLDAGEGLESDNLDQEPEPLEYENTAEAAKAIGAMVKFLRFSMKLHSKKMLACLSVAGVVFALLKYFRSTPKSVPVSQHMPAAPPAQVPVSAPNQPAKLAVCPSQQPVQLPLFLSQQPVQLTVPKGEPPVNSELPLQSPLPMPDQIVSLKGPVQLPVPTPEPLVNFNIPVQFPLSKQTDCGNRDEKIHQEDADNAGSSDSNTVAHREIDSFKPPVVSLLGEFSFVDANSSGVRPRKGSNDLGGDVSVQQPSVSLRKEVVKMKKESSVVKSPGARRTRKEENAKKTENMDSTPTLLRRSNRLLNRVSSP